MKADITTSLTDSQLSMSDDGQEMQKSTLPSTVWEIIQELKSRHNKGTLLSPHETALKNAQSNKVFASIAQDLGYNAEHSRMAAEKQRFEAQERDQAEQIRQQTEKEQREREREKNFVAVEQDIEKNEPNLKKMVPIYFCPITDKLMRDPKVLTL